MKYKVGDRVKIRSYEAMQREFGVSSDGSIATKNDYVVGEMRKFCGQYATIAQCFHGHNYHIQEDNSNSSWDDSMIEHNFQFGEEVEVCYYGDRWGKVKFLSYSEGCLYPFRFVEKSEYYDFDKNGKVGSTIYKSEKDVRKIRLEEIEITLKINGELKPLSTLSEKSLLNARSLSK